MHTRSIVPEHKQDAESQLALSAKQAIRRPKVFVTAFRDNQTLSLGIDLLRQHPPAHFEIANKSDEADIILYIENGYIGLADMPYVLSKVRCAPSARHFLFSECDWPYPILPGAYPSLHRPCRWAHSWCFLPKSCDAGGAGSAGSEEPYLLYSFLGRSRTHPVRQQVLALDGRNSPCLDLADAAGRMPSFEYSKSYWDLIASSKFVLCPRGFGTSSFRIFEAMSCGRVPVIISDRWRRPPGLSWDDFCVFIPERDVGGTADILRAREPEARRMGHKALKAYQQYFAPKVFFDRLLAGFLSKYSDCDSSLSSMLWRTGGALGWREIWSAGSQIKTQLRSGTSCKR